MTHAHCDDCLPPTLQVDPLTIWENIPCPPDDMQDFLFSPELVHKLGPESGISIIVNIAKRCDIEVPTLFPTIGHVTGSWMFDTCGIYCVTTTIVICLSILLVMVLVVTAGFLRKECGWFRWSRDKYVIEHISTIISEDGNLSEYKFSTARSHADTLSKIDDELSSIYVARWFKIFVGEKCQESQHSIHTSLPNSQCICKRLAEHIYEDINSCKDSNEISEDLSSSYRKYSCSDEDIVLINHSGNERESVEEMNSINDSTFVSNNYEPLNRSGNYNDANGANDQNQSASHSRLNDSPIDMHLHATDMEDNDCDTILANPLLITNNYERLNSDNSAHSRTPLIHNDSSDSEELHVYVPILS